MRTLPISQILTRLLAAALVALMASWSAFSSHAGDTDNPLANSKSETQPSAGQPIFRCAFSAADDPAVSWPEHWARQRSAAYPPYLEIRLDDDSPTPDGRSLRMELDGGAAAVSSPSIPIRATASYIFSVNVKTEGLVHDHASFAVTFYDAQNKVLERQLSAPVSETSAWTTLQIGPVIPSSSQIDHAIITLSLEPTDRADLHGSAWFTNISICRLPKMTVDADLPTHLYLDTQHPTVHCNIFSLTDQDTAVTVSLLDVAGRELAHESIPLQIDDAHDIDARRGVALWQPDLPCPGFYRAKISLPGGYGKSLEQEITLAVIHQYAPPISGEFGWTLPRGEKPLALAQLADLAAAGGINWVKFPVWSAAASTDRADQIQTLVDQLDTNHAQLIALLNDPPESITKQLGVGDHPPAAQVFSAKTEIWFPALEPIVAQLSRQIHWWQLGADSDLSFVGDNELTATLERAQKQLQVYGQPAHVGFAWLPTRTDLPAKLPPRTFISLSPATEHGCPDGNRAQGGRTQNVIAGVIGKPQANSSISVESSSTAEVPPYARLLNLSPLPAAQSNTLDRARNLALQMIAAKLDQADGIFIPDLCNSDLGLLNDDGSVGDLLLPWRTTALAITGAKPLGSLRLAGGSNNFIFARDHQLVMAIWNDKSSDKKPNELPAIQSADPQSITESTTLGDRLAQIDLWGRVTEPSLDPQGHAQLAVGPAPIFITNLDEPLVRWQLSASLQASRWPSQLGVPITDILTLTNPYPDSVSGVVRLSNPQRWRFTPREIPFKLAAGETRQIPFEVTLPYDASTGHQELRLDFDLTADRRRQLTVYRPVEVGDDSVTFDIATHLSDQGDLIVEQKLVNKTDEPVSFKCSLFAVDRRRMSTQIVNQSRGSDVQTYHLPNGRALLGQTLWLRAEETSGSRTLNYRFTAEP